MCRSSARRGRPRANSAPLQTETGWLRWQTSAWKKSVRAWQAEADLRTAADRDRLTALADQRIEDERRTWLAEAERRAAEDHLRSQSEVDQRIEAERQTWRAEAEQRADAERRRWEAESLIALGKAQEQWKGQEAERATAARNEWQQQSDCILSQEADKHRRLESSLAAESDKSRKLEAALEALVQARNVPTPDNHPQELDRLHGELAQMQAMLAERDNALSPPADGRGAAARVLAAGRGRLA